jgi:hypothetical protein
MVVSCFDSVGCEAFLPRAEMSEATLISIVDDDALVCDGTAALVESLGYKAVTFTSAEHFLRSDVISETTCLITYVEAAHQRRGAIAVLLCGGCRRSNALLRRTGEPITLPKLPPRKS